MSEKEFIDFAKREAVWFLGVKGVLVIEEEGLGGFG